jgi:enamine deaminase RidA (YjgF/YER057c/UK114 family)
MREQLSSPEAKLGVETMQIQRIAPGAITSRAVQHGNVLYLSGLTAEDKTADMPGQTKQILDKIEKILRDADVTKSALLSAMVFLTDMSKKEEMNAVWKKWIDAKNPPTRTCVGVSELGSSTTLVEITVTAAIG